MFFDIHTHAFHPKIAHKAVDHLNTVYHLDCRGDGTIEHLLEREKAAGIDRCIVLCAATAPAQVIPANNYAMKLQREHEEVIGFGTLHPAYVDWEDELERMKAGGLRGIKLHPDFQGFALNDRRLLPIFESAQDDFVFEIHIGSDDPLDKAPSSPFMLADLMRSFPRLRVIGAHFGGYQMWDYSLEALGDFENLWIDTSSTTPMIPRDFVLRMLACWGSGLDSSPLLRLACLQAGRRQHCQPRQVRKKAAVTAAAGCPAHKSRERGNVRGFLRLQQAI